MTRAYLENIFDKSNLSVMPYQNKYVCMLCELPNGTIIDVGTRVIKGDTRVAIDICKEKIIDEIAKYERYIQADKEKYDYDLSEEYVCEYTGEVI